MEVALRFFFLSLLSVGFCFGSNLKSEFEDQGFLWVKNFFSDEDVAYIQRMAHQMHEDATQERSDLITVPEASDPRKLCRIEDMLGCYPDLNAFIEEKLTQFIEETMEEPYNTFKDKLNFKWPHGGAFVAHQDFPAFAPFPPKSHVNAMICIDPATLENGCLHIAKNWRKTFDECASDHILPYVEEGMNHGSIEPRLVKKIDWLPLETSPHDLILFNSFVPHYSEPNHSDKSRRAMFITYNRAAEGEHRIAYYQMKRNDPENPVFHFATPTNARGK